MLSNMQAEVHRLSGKSVQGLTFTPFLSCLTLAYLCHIYFLYFSIQELFHLKIIFT